jgi:hypothetical protein
MKKTENQKEVQTGDDFKGWAKTERKKNWMMDVGLQMNESMNE